jgi:hypothetical protein
MFKLLLATSSTAFSIVVVISWYTFPGRDPVPIEQESGWAPGPVWMCTRNLAPTGIRSPERPARSQSPYRLSHPAHSVGVITLQNFFVPVVYR